MDDLEQTGGEEKRVMGVGDTEQPEQLISNQKESYGDGYQAHLLEQYKLFVESAQKATDRRITTGNYLLTVNSFLLTVFGVASSQHLGGIWLAIVPLAGLLVSFTWYSVVVFYNNVGNRKYKVIHQLESFLPVAPFRCEWLSTLHKERHTGVTRLERVIPLTFALIYLGLLVYSLLVPSANKPALPTPVPHPTVSWLSEHVCLCTRFADCLGANPGATLF